MFNVDVRKAVADMQKEFSHLSKATVTRAAANAINDTLRTQRTEVRQRVRQQFNFSKKSIEGIDFTKARQQSLSGDLGVKNQKEFTKPMSLTNFNPKADVIMKGRRVGVMQHDKNKNFFTKLRGRSVGKGVQVEIRKGKKVTIPFAFMSRGGQKSVFARGKYKSGNSYGFVKGKSRLPIAKLVGTSIYGAAYGKNDVGLIQRDSEQYFGKRMLHHLNYYVGKMKSE